ncbi:MAG TPA: response regulator [Polyangiaceae bacterium]|nr:response regulator [Polyangiaceae bacterium]
MTEKKQIGKILLRQRALSPDQLERALAERKGGRLASRLAADGTITDVSALKALSEQHGIPGIDLNQVCLRLENLDLLPREIAEKHLILPVLVRDDRIFIAMANPRETKVVDEIEFVTGKKVYPYVALEGALERVIQEAYVRKTRGEEFYVGPTCPPEVLKKLGLDSSGRSEPESLPPQPDFGTGFTSSRPLEAPGVVVDDDVGRVSRADEIAEEDFGNVGEASVVTALPEDAPVSLLPEPPPGAKSVLVVDDEADIRRMLARLLAKRGYRVLEADRGLLALRLVKEHTPDLIVLDAMLPEVHGFEIARRIKGSQRYGHVPIIMVSAVYRGWRYAEDLKQNFGVDEFIEKPFRIGDVVAKVEECLARKETAKAKAPAAPGAGAATDGDGETNGLSTEAERALAEGVAAYQAGRIDEAVAHLRRGIGIDPLAFRLHFHLGLLFGRKGEVFDAISELETAVSLNGSHFAATKNLAILYQKAGFRHKAVEMWERAHSLAPDDATRLSIKEHLLRLL